MKLLIVTPYFPPKTGEVEHYTYNISLKLLERGHDVNVITTGTGGVKEEILDGIMVRRLKTKNFLSNTPLDIHLVHFISRILKEENFDIINAHMPVPFYADMSAIVSKRAGVPFVLTYHNDVVKNRGPLSLISSLYNHTLLQITLRAADRIITPSPYVYNESDIMKEFSKKLVLIPPGVDPELYSPSEGSAMIEYGLNKESKSILFVGSMNRGHTHKGVEILLKAFSRIESDETYLILAGTGDMIPEYKKIAESLGIGDRTIFTGFINEESLIELYRLSSLLVLPTISVAEGFGMVLIEANACGTPVIGSEVGGIKYVVRDGETGILVPPGDPVALANAITRLLDNEELAAKMGSNGRKMVMKNYTWDKSARMTERVFKEVIS
ncbi:glycosyltransferase family 4 protein [Methanothermobacter sp. K4]|uniref:glycosyltransferase family 4 protein n=1 Tax=Methanothermobacter sp. K4 TaxID=2913262 RepID=UPI001EDB6FAE|nr:glycosyltransferase family 4 protein [Methanothermobacter sp. K4]MCG2829229.1 glycosyltransferase family 4 protein [Methanothermobacter sp. K4]